jgi:hypothetical protein
MIQFEQIVFDPQAQMDEDSYYRIAPSEGLASDSQKKRERLGRKKGSGK